MSTVMSVLRRAILPVVAAGMLVLTPLAAIASDDHRVTATSQTTSDVAALSSCQILRGAYIGYRVCEYQYVDITWTDGRQQTFVVGTNSAYSVYTIYQRYNGDPVWSGWQSLGGSATDSVHLYDLFYPTISVTGTDSLLLVLTPEDGVVRSPAAPMTGEAPDPVRRSGDPSSLGRARPLPPVVAAIAAGCHGCMRGSRAGRARLCRRYPVRGRFGIAAVGRVPNSSRPGHLPKVRGLDAVCDVADMVDVEAGVVSADENYERGDMCPGPARHLLVDGVPVTNVSPAALTPLFWTHVAPYGGTGCRVATASAATAGSRRGRRSAVGQARPPADSARSRLTDWYAAAPNGGTANRQFPRTQGSAHAARHQRTIGFPVRNRQFR